MTLLSLHPTLLYVLVTLILTSSKVTISISALAPSAPATASNLTYWINKGVASATALWLMIPPPPCHHHPPSPLDPIHAGFCLIRPSVVSCYRHLLRTGRVNNWFLDLFSDGNQHPVIGDSDAKTVLNNVWTLLMYSYSILLAQSKVTLCTLVIGTNRQVFVSNIHGLFLARKPNYITVVPSYWYISIPLCSVTSLILNG